MLLTSSSIFILNDVVNVFVPSEYDAFIVFSSFPFVSSLADGLILIALPSDSVSVTAAFAIESVDFAPLL